MKFIVCFTFVIFLTACDNNGTKVHLDEAWLSSFFNKNGDHTFVVIDEDSSGVYYSPTPAGNCYASEHFMITDGVIQVNDWSYTYSMDENSLILYPIADYDTTLFGYPVPQQFTKTNNVEIKQCD
ncbi:hypothetical protein HUU42_13530 [bacterium]|nr:hypothetical protein [bacterium]